MEHNKQQEKDFQLVVGNVLRYGVWSALSVALLGGILYLLRHGNETVDYSTFIENDRSIFTVVAEVMSDAASGNAVSIIFIGILLLFITPMVRMLLSLFSFIKEKDYLYTGITLLVIGIICMSIALGFSH